MFIAEKDFFFVEKKAYHEGIKSEFEELFEENNCSMCFSHLSKEILNYFIFTKKFECVYTFFYQDVYYRKRLFQEMLFYLIKLIEDIQ